MAEPERTEKEWALQRRLEDVFVKLGEKYGDLTGRVETKIKSTITFDDVGGLRRLHRAGIRALARGRAARRVEKGIASRFVIPGRRVAANPESTNKH